MDFLFLGERGEKGRDWEEVNVNWGFEGVCKLPASCQQVRGGGSGIKVEFGGFIGGFGKIFFTKGGIKREKEGFWGRIGVGGKRIYIFLKIFKGVEKSSKLYRGMYFWGWDGELGTMPDGMG